MTQAVLWLNLPKKKKKVRATFFLQLQHDKLPTCKTRPAASSLSHCRDRKKLHCSNGALARHMGRGRKKQEKEGEAACKVSLQAKTDYPVLTVSFWWVGFIIQTHFDHNIKLIFTPNILIICQKYGKH